MSVAGFISKHTKEEYDTLKIQEHEARKPYPSWVGDINTMSWSAPVPYPNDEKHYRWDEPTISWI